MSCRVVLVERDGSDVSPFTRLAVAALTASLVLDAERSTLYADLVLAALSEAARKSLHAMDPAKYEYQSEFAKRYLSQGRVEGRATTLLEQFQLEFGPLAPEVIDRIQSASIPELDLWAERILNATALEDVLR